MNIVENGVDIDNKDVEKRANWVVRLLELRSRWRNKPQRENLNGDEDGAADSDGEEGGCEVDYDEVEARENYNRETFSRLLSPVAWSDTKFFSQLAFLCNMAYVIPEIKVCFLFLILHASCSISHGLCMKWVIHGVPLMLFFYSFMDP